MSKKPASDEDLFTLMGWVGAALTQWQQVEDAHYLFFLKILGAPKPEVCSVIYFSPPTFESRRVMVDRVAHYTITGKEDKKTWNSEPIGGLVAGTSSDWLKRLDRFPVVSQSG
jgi:hypothetical protein